MQAPETYATLHGAFMDHAKKITPDAAPPSRRSWSLAQWFTVCNTACSFGIVICIALFAYLGLAAQLESQSRIHLMDEVWCINEIIEHQGGVAPQYHKLTAGHSGKYHKRYIRFVAQDGTVLAESAGMAEAVPARLFPPSPPDGTAAPELSGRTPQGRPVLATSQLLHTLDPAGRRVLLQVALDAGDVEQLLAGYRQRIYLALCAGFLLCLASSYLVARRGTRPLTEVTELLRRVTVTNLSERLSGRGWPRELCALSNALNLMMDRLDHSFSGLYRSAVNLSHKMRTPLTILRGQAEVALSRERSVEELQEVIASSLEEVGRLTRLSENILFLANAEMGKSPVERSFVDCREEVEQVVEFYAPSAEEKGIVLSCTGDGGAVADPVLFRRLVSALVSNALTYNNPGGRVAVTVRQREPFAAEVAVSDTGCGIPAAEMTKIFDRFYRIYPTRHMDPQGTGLGLPIAKAIVELHDGSISIDSAPGEGTTVTAIIPAPAMPQAHSFTANFAAASPC